jgi:hypothetical protein
MTGGCGSVAPFPVDACLLFVKRRALGGRTDDGFPIAVCCALGWPGDDLLSRVLRRSTIGAGAFDGRVRDGIGSSRFARATRPAKGGGSMGLVGRWRRGTEEAEQRTVSPSVFAICFRRRFVIRIEDERIKSNERLVPVSFTRRRASTSGLSTWWSTTALKGELVLRQVSRLDAFSGYPFRT